MFPDPKYEPDAEDIDAEGYIQQLSVEYDALQQRVTELETENANLKHEITELYSRIRDARYELMGNPDYSEAIDRAVPILDGKRVE